jgi:hypothetical protein
MVAKKTPRKGRKTAPITPSSRDSGQAVPRVEAAPGFPPEPATPAPALFPQFATDDVDALARSSAALADGVQSFGQALIEMQRQSLSAGLSAASALVDARNLQDVIEIQRRYVSGSVESAVREAGGLAQIASRVANEAWAPLVPRFGTASGARERR